MKLISLHQSLLVLSALAFCSPAQAMELSWNGFGSAYYAQSLKNDVLPYAFVNNRPNFTDFSLFGLNLSAKLGDNWSAAGQLIALGDRNVAMNTPYATYGVQASWAYVGYKSDGGFGLRAGRQRFPIFTASEYIYEHYELPFREMPAIVYEMAPFVAFDGASVSQEFDLGAGKINLQVFGGTPILAVIPPSGGTTMLSNLLGARVNFEGDGWRVRAQASRATIANLSTANVLSIGDNNFLSAGYRFDKFNFISWGEMMFRNAPNATVNSKGKYLGRGISGYVLVGARLANWLPRYTLARASASEGSAGVGSVTSHTIGLNYYFNTKVVAKAEYEINIVPSVGGGYKVTQQSSTGTSGSALYVGLDFLM